MADKDTTTLTATTELVSSDLLYAVDGGNSRKITATNLAASLAKLLATEVSVSAASACDVPLGSADFYRIDYHFIMSDDGVSLQGQVTNDAFSTVENGAGLYSYYDDRRGTGGTGTSSSDSATLMIFQNPIGNATGEYCSGHIFVAKAADSGQFTAFHGGGTRLNATGQQNTDENAATYRVAETINGLRLYPSAGTLTGIAVVTPLSFG